MAEIGDPKFMESALQEKLKDPSREIALEIFNLLAPKAEVETNVIMAAVSMVLSTIAVEMGMEEEKAVYAFTRSFRNAKSRLKKLVKQVH
jgi:hypothetical protein